jgi:acyl CoA:acetate/3-ketoacid CoA transferase
LANIKLLRVISFAQPFNQHALVFWVPFIPDRCVFRLIASGLKLIEIAPVIEIERDIFPYMQLLRQLAPT